MSQVSDEIALGIAARRQFADADEYRIVGRIGIDVQGPGIRHSQGPCGACRRANMICRKTITSSSRWLRTE
jgi:hypothetical protein